MVVTTKNNTLSNTISNQVAEFQPSSEVSWLVMIYLDGDIDYEWGPLDSIQELELGFSDESNVEVVFIIDRIDGIDSSNGDWTDTRLYRLRHDNDPMSIGSELVEILGEKNMGDNATLRDFVIWAQESYPADKSALVIFNHGGALSGICWDWTSNHDHMTLDEVQQGMTGLHVDLVVAEACSMGYLEVAYEWRTFADYFAASEVSMQIETLDYQGVMEELCANPSMEPWTLGEFFVQKYADNYQYDFYKAFSLINCSKLNEFMDELDTLGTKLTDALPTNITLISNLRGEMRTLLYDSTVDIGNMIDVLQDGFVFNSSITTTLNNLETIYNEVVLSNTTEEFNFPSITGLALFFPQDNESVLNWRDYLDHGIPGDLTNLDILEDTSWDDFLAEYIDIAPVLEPRYSANIHDEESLEMDFEYELELKWNVTEIFFFQVSETGMYNFTLEIDSGDPAISLSNIQNNYAIFTEFPFSNLKNPEQGNIEQINIPMKKGIILIQIGSFTESTTATFTITKSPPNVITLNQENTGEFSPANGVQPPSAVYSNYALELEAGSYIIEIDIDYPTGLEVFIISSTGYHYLNYRYGILGMDFNYILNTTLTQTITIYFGSYAGSSEYSLKIRTTVEENATISILFSMLAIPTVYVIVKQRKKKRN